jgi:hypothetical protein
MMDFLKFICKRFKHRHFSTGKYKNCSCLTNLHAETLAARRATLPPLQVHTGVAVRKHTQNKNTPVEGLTVREGCEFDVCGSEHLGITYSFIQFQLDVLYTLFLS